MCIKINWSVKTPWHRPSMRVARSGLWAPDIRLIDLGVWANCHQAKRPSGETTQYLSNGLNGLCHAICYLFKKIKLVFLSIQFHKHSISDGSRGGAWGARPLPIFRPNWGPKGRKTISLRPRPSHLISGSGWPGLPLIWRYGSATDIVCYTAVFSVVTTLKTAV